MPDFIKPPVYPIYKRLRKVSSRILEISYKHGILMLE